jgi:MFS family permease
MVSESLSKEDRGYATTFIATLGMLGSLCAALVGKYFAWNHAYMIGGFLGLALLAARLKTFDSVMFKELLNKKVERGNLKILFTPKRSIRYICSVAVGIPIYFITGILLTMAPEVTSELKLTGPVTAADALIYGSIGLALGDLASGLVSQWLKSRKKAIFIFLVIALITIVFYTQAVGRSPQYIYWLCLIPNYQERLDIPTPLLAKIKNIPIFIDGIKLNKYIYNKEDKLFEMIITHIKNLEEFDKNYEG